jgi:hypothetical protein
MQVEDNAKVARNAELAELVEAMREARALPVEHTARGEASAKGAAVLGGASSELEGDDVLVAGDLEDDFILSVLDADSLPLHGGTGLDTVLEALTEDDGSDGTDRDLGESDEEEEEEEHGGAQPDDVLASSAAQQRARRAQRHVDDAFDALAAAEYDSDDIGCAPHCLFAPLDWTLMTRTLSTATAGSWMRATPATGAGRMCPPMALSLTPSAQVRRALQPWPPPGLLLRLTAWLTA